MKELLTPAAILILAVTQVPGMIRDISHNRCIQDAVETMYYIDEPASTPRGNAKANNYCNGGDGN